MIDKKTRDILKAGIKIEEASDDGCCIHTWPEYETGILYGHYMNICDKGINTELDDVIMEALAECWSEYIRIGHEEYWKDKQREPFPFAREVFYI